MVKARTRLAVWVLLWVLGGSRAEAGSGRIDRTYRSPVDGVVRGYSVTTPTGYDGVRRLPAMLFLHGRGGYRGSFLTTPYLERADRDGFVLIFWEGRFVTELQAFSTYYVDGVNGVPDESDVLACLDDALSGLAIDPDRVHLVGFSQGGKGALLVGLGNPDRFASISDGAGPSDAFQGMLWAPGFPDFAAAAGGAAEGASGGVLARWYAQSPRFLLPNARNVPLGIFHGTADDVVPDSPFLFRYRNSHHIASVPGFTDERGRTPTLLELHAADPGGYLFSESYPPGVGHDQTLVLSPPALFGFTAGKTRVRRPSRVVARNYEAKERSFYWLKLGRLTPPDGTAAGVVADLEGPSGLHLVPTGSPAVTVDLVAAGLDASARLLVRIDPGSALSLRLRGPFPAGLRVVRDDVLLTVGIDYQRIGTDVSLEVGPSGSNLTLEPPPPAEILETDLLVPALVDAVGQLGSHFRSSVVLANLGEAPATLEALFLGPSGLSPRTATLAVPARSTRLLSSAEMLAAVGLVEGAGPLRLRVLSGDPARILASARVFNGREETGAYGLSLPVASAGSSVLLPGEAAELFGGTPGHPSRMNLSLFAPFEDAVLLVSIHAPDGTLVRAIPVSLPRLSRTQLNDLLVDVPAPARVSIAVTVGRVQAYGIVVDNSPNNDSFWSPPLVRSRSSVGWTVPAVASAPGRAGATFTSDLYLAAPAEGPPAGIPVTVDFLPRGLGEPVSAASVTVLPGTTLVLEDVLETLFHLPVPAAGALRVTAPDSVSVFAVTRSDSASGPACQGTSAVADGLEVTSTSPAAFVGLEESDRARSNLILVNRGPATVVTLSLLSEDGPRGQFRVSLAEGEVRQLDSVTALFGGAPVRAGTLIVTPDAGASVILSAVRIDNRSNDPAGLTAIPVPAW